MSQCGEFRGVADSTGKRPHRIPSMERMVTMTAYEKRIFHEANSPNTRSATGFPQVTSQTGLHAQPLAMPTWAGGAWTLLLALFALLFAPQAARAANQFSTIPTLNFSTTYTVDTAMSQVITVTSTGTAITFKAAASTNSGGSWLTINPSNYGFGVSTPYAITVSVAPAVTLAAGKYTGQIVLTATGVNTETINVNLVVHAPTETYFDQIAGALSFSMLTSGTAPPAQALQVRNGGANSLSWTAAANTADGGTWITLSSAGGTAPSNLTVGVSVADLPGGGASGGTFTGQVVFTSANDTITVPIVFTVGSNVFAQINPLSFQKVFAGPNPISQELTVASTTSTPLVFKAVVSNATGGNWLVINPSNYGFGQDTPYNITVSVNPTVTLAAGTYVAQVIVETTDSTQTMAIPVSLTVNPSTATYFDNVAGAMNFSMVLSGNAPPSQDIQIRGLGPSALNWNAAATTADGGNWLTISAASGSSPSFLTVTVNPANVPAAGVTAQTMVGQVVLTGSGSRVTIPVSFSLGAAVFRQVAPINFVMPLGGGNPLTQVVTIGSTGASIPFAATVIPGTGGTWLSINPTNYGFGQPTPYQVDISVSPAVTLGAGTYTSEILVYAVNYSETMTIPVTLTIEPKTNTFFDSLPGQMTFSMVTSGTAPPAQVLPIRNAGGGSLDWTATLTTADGGDWLNISADSGTAPSLPTVSVNPNNLPSGAVLLGGTFTGMISLNQNGQEISIPVTFLVGANVFQQMNPLTFTMIQGGANPLPQVVAAGSTGTTAVTFLATVYNSTGGNWLSINPSNYGFGVATPFNITASVNAPITMTAGTYSAEIVLHSADNSQGMTIPVTLIVLPKTATMFDSVVGQLSFSMALKGTAPPSLPIEIRNAGGGTLDWNAVVTTSDGGSWLSISTPSGVAPSVALLTVNPANVTGAGLLAGTFTGQVILETAGDSVTIPVSFTIGNAVYQQPSGLHFNVLAGATTGPLPQLFSLTSTGHITNPSSGSLEVTTIGTVANSTGGSWLTITPSSYGFGINTPIQVVVTPKPAVTLGPGTYTSEIIFTGNSNSQAAVVPVTLTVNPATATYFGDMQGAVTFSVPTGSTTNPPAQSVPIRAAGTGALPWTASATTADGGAWLHLSATSGVAGSSLGVSITVANLPNTALIAGEFNGHILLVSGSSRQTIPVAVDVGTALFAPTPTIAFSKPYAGANPGFKEMNVTSTGGTVTFFGQAASALGGNWLGINPSNFGFGQNTPLGIQVTASPAVTLVPGLYTGETIFTSADGTQGQAVPVTLNVYAVPAATPTISLKSGTYTGVQTVTLKDTTPGAAIYYSTTGKAPTNASTRYTTPIKIAASQKLMVIAYATGYLPSAVASSTYTIVVNTPVFSAKNGTYPKSFSFTMTDAMPNSTIYYTTNGATPTTASTKYTKGKLISVSTNETVKAMATAPGCHQSLIAIAAYQIQTAKPVITPAGGSIVKGKTVTITDATKGAVIYYTTNKTTPTAKSTRYTGPIKINVSETIEAVAIASKYVASPVASASFTAK